MRITVRTPAATILRTSTLVNIKVKSCARAVDRTLLLLLYIVFRQAVSGPNYLCSVNSFGGRNFTAR